MKRSLLTVLLLAVALVVGVWLIRSQRLQPGRSDSSAGSTPAQVAHSVEVAASTPALPAATPFPTPAPASLPAMFQAPGRWTGSRLTAERLRERPQAGGKLIGRIASLEVASFARLDGFRAGQNVLIPLFGGERAEGVVNLVQAEPNGWVRMGGDLSGGRSGTFYLARKGGEVAGFVDLPAERLMYVISTERDGRTVLAERPRGELVCEAMPREDAAPLAAAAAAITVPILNSRSSATHVLYLDFDGEVIADPAWAGGRTINAAAFNLSSADITHVFNGVAEDWRPFNINVTTDFARFQAAPRAGRMWCIITPTEDAKPGAGGVAYLSSYSSGFSRICWAFNSGTSAMIQTISHELGHTMGLDHDGREIPNQGHEEYFGGHGSGTTGWSPIMGGPSGKSVGQWSKGEYRYANNREDDLAIISSTTNRFGYATDLAGNSRDSAAPLAIEEGTNAINQVGVIERNNDLDFLYFSTAGGKATITASPSSQPNLDIALQLQDANGAVLATHSPADALNASVSATLAGGQYFVSIKNSSVGDGLTSGYTTYGSIGRFTLSGTIEGAQLGPVINTPPLAEGRVHELFRYAIVASGNVTLYGVIGTLPSGLGLNTATGVISGFPMEAGTFEVQVTAKDAVGGRTAPLRIIIAPAAITLAEAVDFLALGWSTGGDVPWRGQALVSSDGEDAVQASGLADGQAAYFVTNVTGPTKVSFRWKVSSEAGGDMLAFQIDGADAPGLAISGEMDWTAVSDFDVPAGPHQLRWVFRKNAALAQGADSAWVDAIEFRSPAVPQITSPATASGTVGNPFAYQAAATQIPGSFAITAGALPLGLALDAATGRVSGVPAAAGNFSATLAATNHLGTGTLAIGFTISPSPLSFGQALDDTVAWTTGGNVPWFPETAEKYFGGSALQAGPIGGDQASFVTTTITGPRTINFWWKAQCEPGGDRLRFLVDNVEKAQIAGFTDWENRIFTVPSGSHVLKWVYEKDALTSLGADAAWLDKVVITTKVVPVVSSAAEATGRVGAGFSFNVTATSSPDTYSAEGLPPGLSINATSGTITGTPSASGNFTVLVAATNEAGTGSKSMTLRLAPLLADIGEAVDTPQLVWTTGGDAPWFAQNDLTYDGVDAARSGQITDGQSSFVETEVTNNAATGWLIVRYRWRVSGSSGDKLQLFLDGTPQNTFSADSTWGYERSVSINAGTHQLRWVYSKDATGAGGQDAAWLDAFDLRPRATFSNSSLTIYLRRSFLTTVTVDNQPTSVSVSGLPPGLAFDPASRSITGVPEVTGTYVVQYAAANAYGVTTSTLSTFRVIEEPPGADRFSDATSLGGLYVSSKGTTQQATREVGEPQHGKRAYSRSVWWKWTAPASGEVQIDAVLLTYRNDIDFGDFVPPRALAVYQGETFGELVSLAGTDKYTKKTSSSTIKFKARKGQTYRIAFATDGWLPVTLSIGYTAAATFQGIAEEPSGSRMPGLVTLTVTGKLQVTGSILLDYGRQTVRGSLASGILSSKFVPGPLPIGDLQIELDRESGAEEITGSFKLFQSPTVTYAFRARRTLAKADVPTSMIGGFTYAILSDETGADFPGGVGSGKVTISTSGKVTGTGFLGDGSKLSFGAPLRDDHTFILYALPYTRGGFAAGTIAVAPDSAVASPLDGALGWQKNVDDRAKLYSGGFAVPNARFKGYPYKKPGAGTRILTLPLESLDVRFSGSDLSPEPADFTATLDGRNKLIGAPAGSKLTFVPATGLFSGSFLDPQKKRHSINGAVLQSPNEGVGVFIGSEQTGRIELKPVSSAPTPFAPK